MLDKNTHQKTIKSIYRYAYFKLRNKEEAEDVASESLSRLIEQLEKQEIENKEGYAFRIAQNLIYSKYKERQLTSPEVDPTEEVNITKDYLPNPTETRAIDSVLSEKVQAAITELDDLTQDVILMRIWDDLPFQTIADSMQANLVTTKHRYYRGIEKVKQILQSNSNNKSITTATIATAIFAASTKPAYAAPAAILSIKGTSMTALKTFLATTTGKAIILGLAGIVTVSVVAGAALYPQNPTDNVNNNNSSTTTSRSSSAGSSSTTTSTEEVSYADKYTVTVKDNASGNSNYDVYITNNETNTEEFFGTIPNVYAEHYHNAEYHDGVLYIIRRIDYDGYPDNDWSDQLWAYTSADAGT